MTIKRRVSKRIRIGKIAIGGTAPIIVQSMPTVRTAQVKEVVRQIHVLEKAGCELIRVSILDQHDAIALKAIKKEIHIPLCADIHFDYKLALASIAHGADKIRMNPGNMKRTEDVREIVAAAKSAGVPIRVGANSGSVDKERFKKLSPGAQLAESVLSSVSFMEKLRCTQLVVSAKGNTVCDTIDAYRYLAKKVSYPLHIGLTASGTGEYAIIKSSVGLGSLLSEGIGDTIRVSLTDDPVREIEVAYQILQSLGLKERPWEVIACPTCGRTEISVIAMAHHIETLLKKGKLVVPKTPYKIAVMGCVVNGPGEAREADIGISGGRGFGFIFKKGTMIAKVPEQKLVRALMKEMKK